MCGIVAAIRQDQVLELLIQGLKRLEYRGYDSSGIAWLHQNQLQRVRAVGKVQALCDKLDTSVPVAQIGIAHTRWATHGKPSEENAHPHRSGSVCLVHNGIIENHAAIRQSLIEKGFCFTSETDTEVIAHLIAWHYSQTPDFFESVRLASLQLEGAYAIVVLHEKHPKELICLRHGAPLVIGLGAPSENANYIASDPLALTQVTNRFIYLDEKQLARVTQTSVEIFDADAQSVQPEIHTLSVFQDQVDKGTYRHFMLKEIYEQPKVIQDTINHYQKNTLVRPDTLEKLKQVKALHLVACGTSFHACLVARLWFETWVGVPVSVEVASEYRYRPVVVPQDSLLVVVSQSGETADTLAALKIAKNRGYVTRLAICNVAGSSLTREADDTLLTLAGTEIGVASTKAFVAQLMSFWVLVSQMRLLREPSIQADFSDLNRLSDIFAKALALEKEIEQLAERFRDKQHALFLGRGLMAPLAMEGALKLKEISYIHAEAYPAGELKHGPLALIDQEMPVIACLPQDPYVDKTLSNLEEVKARGGELFLFVDESLDLASLDAHVVKIPSIDSNFAPILYASALQLLSYHVALIKGTDVDQPRNLAKSVTVE